MNNWILAGILVGPLMYIAITLSAKPPVSSDDYEYGNRQLNPSDVLDSSIMYALQVAAIALFATWGHMYGFAAVVVPLFWMAGYVLFSWLLTDDFLEKFSSDARFRTLHDFLADHGTSRTVCIAAALLTLVGLSGPAMFEAFTVGKTIVAAAPALGASGSAGLAMAFLIIALIYMIKGGFAGLVRLEQLQIAIGYGGFNVAFAGILLLYGPSIGQSQVIAISTICLICTVIFFTCKVLYHIKVVRYLNRFPTGRSYTATYDLLGWLACSLGILSYATVLWLLPTSSGQSDLPIAESLSHIDWNLGFSGFALISLFVANALYQFVDVTQWQRLLSINVNDQDRAGTNDVLRANVLFGGICSTATWIIAIALGVFLKHLYPDDDPYGVLFHFMATLGSGTGQYNDLVLFVLIASLIAVMFSTLDSLVAGTAFTVQNDILAGVLKYCGVASLLVARLSTVVVVIIQLALYLFVSSFAGDRVDAVLYVCWSFQLAMFPLVVGLLRGRGGSHWARVAAMVSGSVAAMWPLLNGDPNRVYEFSPWLTVLVSSVVFFALGGMRVPRSAAVEPLA